MSDPILRLRRILNMIPLVRQSSGITVRELCERLDVSRKELMLDLERIFLCGVPPYLPHDYILVTQEDEVVTVDFADHFKRPVQLTLREALALKLALETLPPLTGELRETADGLLATVNKLVKLQGSELDLDDLDGRISVPHNTALSSRLDELERLLEARREITIRYYSASSTELSTRRIRPYALVDQGGNYYLISHCCKSDDIRSFRVDRITEILDTEGLAFELPSDLDLAALAATIRPPTKAGVLVKARFDASIARWIKEDYADESKTFESDGSVVVTFRTGSIAWAAQKMLGYGELVEVLSPDSLIAELKRRLLSASS